jgi:hypothetical protein
MLLTIGLGLLGAAALILWITHEPRPDSQDPGPPRTGAVG